MADLKQIDEEIEKMRESLHELVLKKKCKFVDEDVTKLSQELDLLIVQYERCKLEERKQRK